MSFPRYPHYKPSGVEWLGEVPEHWELPKLKTIASFSGGGTPNRENRDYWNGEIPWVSPKDMKSERIINSEESITQDGLMNSSSNLLQSGHVLMVVRSGILKHTIPIAINDVAVSLNQDMKALNFDIEKCLGQFFFRWVQGLNNQLLLAWAKQGATVESIEHSYLVDTVVPLPSIDEQIIIISFLDRETAKIDALVAEQQRLIELLKEKRQAVISHAVTKGLDPTVPMKPSGIEWLGDIPAHWDLLRLKYAIGKLEQGWSPQCESEPAAEDEWGVLKVGCGNRDHFDPSEQKALPPNIEPLKEYEIQPGDILMSRGNTLELVGLATFIEHTRPKLLISDLLYRFRPLTKRADGSFVVYFLRSPQGRTQIEREATGTSASMKKIGQSTIRELVLAFPPIQEQREIVSQLRISVAKFDTLTAEAERAIELLQERRTALISAAVTGQIDVRQLAQGVAA